MMEIKDHHMEVMGYQINTELEGLLSMESAENTIGRTLLINTLNPHAYCTAKKDPLFAQSLRESDVLLPDGIGIVIAAAVLKGKKIHKIAGADLHEFLLKRLNETHGTCFYLGASQKTLDLIKVRLAQEFPDIRAGFFSPPYSPQFTHGENKQMLEAVNNYELRIKNEEYNQEITNYEYNSTIQQFNNSTIQQLPPPAIDVLFVGMTAPKQEKWAFEHRDELNVRMICSIGAVFDFYAGTVKRSSPFWISIGMEWFPRLLREPRRLYKRVFLSGPEFLFDLFLYLFKIKKA